MPSVPGFVADLVETRFGTLARVVAVEVIAPSLRRVRFRSHALAAKHAAGKFPAGVYTVEFRAGRTQMRHYTACSWDLPTGAFDVLFFSHGLGPGRSWAEGLRVGDEVRALGPGSRVAVESAQRHIVIGDETSVGNARAVVECAGDGARVEGALACRPATAALVELAGGSFAPVVGLSQADLTNGLIEWLTRARASVGDTYYVTGNRDTVMAVGQYLLKARGVPKRAIHLRNHWVEGKAGL